MKDLKKEHLILLRQRAWLSLKDSHALEIEPRTVSTKIDILAFADHLHPISNILSIGTLYGFLLKYITLSYLNWLQNGKLLNLEVQKKCLKYDDLCSKMHLFQALFLDFQIQQLAILKPVEVGKSYIPQKKAL